jgi:hypothetical protein
MELAYLQHPTDKVVFETLVQLVRKVTWGPTRDQLERQAHDMREQAAALKAKWHESFALGGYAAGEREMQAGLERQMSELDWKSDLFILAAQARFPREGDRVVGNFTENLVEDLREFQAKGYRMHSAAMRDVSEVVERVLDDAGLSLSDLPLPPTIDELIDRGAERPAHVSEERWEKEVRAFYRRMTLDNTPDDFIYGDADEFDTGCEFDDVDYSLDYDDLDADDRDEIDELADMERAPSPVL